MKTAALCEDVLLRVEESDAALTPSRGTETATSQLTTVLREDLAGLAEQRREELIDALASNAATVKTLQPHQLAESLRQIREALRERFPNCESIKDSPRGLRGEGVLAIDEETFYIHGWGYDARS